MSLLVENSPNPFGGETTVRYHLPQSTRHMELAVYNLKGQKVRTLVNGPRPRGIHTTVWDGRDDRGSEAASGVYFYSINVGTERSIGRMVLLR